MTTFLADLERDTLRRERDEAIVGREAADRLLAEAYRYIGSLEGSLCDDGSSRPFTFDTYRPSEVPARLAAWERLWQQQDRTHHAA